MSDDHNENSGPSLDEFKETVNHYMESHARASEKYEQHIDELLTKYQTEGAQGKTIGDLLKPGGELDERLKAAFDEHLNDMGFKASKYGREVLLRDLGVSIEDLREAYKGRLKDKYDSKLISGIMDQAQQTLANKLGVAVFSEMQKLEGTDQYKDAVKHIVSLSDQENFLPTLHEDVYSHADVVGKLRNNRTISNLSNKAQTYFKQGMYDSGGDNSH